MRVKEIIYSKDVTEKYFPKKDQIAILVVFKHESLLQVFDSLHFSLVKLDSFLEEIKKDPLFMTNFQAEFKIVGSESKKEEIIKKLIEKNFSNYKYIIRNAPYEFFYLGSENKIRVSIEEISQTPKKVKVLIVDDSSTIRNLFSKIFSQDERFHVLEPVDLPSKVEPAILRERPDVITLDIHMPEMNGFELLKKIYPLYKIPTIMISSISIQEGPLVMDALNSGAVDYLQKPDLKTLKEMSPGIIEKVYQTSLAKQKTVRLVPNYHGKHKGSAGETNGLIFIGSSTGGVAAIQEILSYLPDHIPPILIVQHIPAVFSKAFADRLNNLFAFRVKEAEPNEVVTPSTVYIAPGGKQMKLRSSGKDFIIEINDDPPVNRFRPSVDYFFHSLKDLVLPKSVGVILTGMGKDGAEGLLGLKNKGIETIAQNEETCVVFGMPREAIKINAANHILSLHEIGDKMIDLVQNSQKKKKI